MSETLSVSQWETEASIETLEMLRDMTDGVLIRAGLNPVGHDMPPVTEFRYSNQALNAARPQPYGLRIFSIGEGVPGYNTSSAGSAGEDNSRRWDVNIDRNTDFAIMFDNKGTVYECGQVHTPFFAPNSPSITIATPALSVLIPEFYNHPDTTVSFTMLHEDEDGRFLKDNPASDSMFLRPDLVMPGGQTPGRVNLFGYFSRRAGRSPS